MQLDCIAPRKHFFVFLLVIDASLLIFLFQRLIGRKIEPGWIVERNNFAHLSSGSDLITYSVHTLYRYIQIPLSLNRVRLVKLN